MNAATIIGNLRRGDLIADKYRVEGVIGEGGMGIVLYAIHVDLDRPVAIKVVRDELAQREEIVARMLLEAKTAATIRSEHAGRVLDVGRLPTGSPFIVMEYLDGCDLCTLIDQQGRLPIDVAVDFILQASEAVAEAHACGIIHRDLKPENLFLTNRVDGAAIIKVLDFGISKNLNADRESAITNATTAVGSPFYMSPEQMRLKNVDARADVWSLGAILYELLSGYPPFNAETIPAVCAKVMHDDPIPLRTFNPEVSEQLEQVVLRCLQKNPNDRYADVGAFATALVPHGTVEAPRYAERIQRVIASVPSNRPGMRLSVPSAPDLGATTQPALVVTTTQSGQRLLALPPTSQRGVQLSPSGSVLPSVYTPSSSIDMAPPKRRRGLVAVLVLMLMAAAGAGGFFFFQHTQKQAALAETPPAEPEVTARPAVNTAPVVVEEQAKPVAAAPEPSAKPTPTKAAPRRSGVVPAAKKPAAAPAPSTAPKPASSSAPKNDAWNTDAFGGRG